MLQKKRNFLVPNRHKPASSEILMIQWRRVIRKGSIIEEVAGMDTQFKVLPRHYLSRWPAYALRF